MPPSPPNDDEKPFDLAAYSASINRLRAELAAKGQAPARRRGRGPDKAPRKPRIDKGVSRTATDDPHVRAMRERLNERNNVIHSLRHRLAQRENGKRRLPRARYATQFVIAKFAPEHARPFLWLEARAEHDGRLCVAYLSSERAYSMPLDVWATGDWRPEEWRGRLAAFVEACENSQPNLHIVRAR